MSYDVRQNILRGLVRLLRPSKDDIDSRPEILDGESVRACVRAGVRACVHVPVCVCASIS